MDAHEVKKCLPVQYPVSVDEGGRDLSSRVRDIRKEDDFEGQLRN
jgi:hypothetical protein